MAKKKQLRATIKQTRPVHVHKIRPIVLIKQNLGFFLLISIFVIFFLFVAVSLYAGKTSIYDWIPESKYCERNPGQCIFEPTPIFLNISKSRSIQPVGMTHQEWCGINYAKVLADYSGNKSIIGELCNSRKKTTAELETYYCLNHSSDFNRCRCTTIIPVEPFCYSVSFCDPINKTDCKTLVTCSYLEPGLLCPKARPLTECEKRNKTFKCLNPGGDADGNYYCAPENCLSKTECEKRTPGWKEEPRFNIRCLSSTNIIIPFYNLTYEEVLQSINLHPKCVVDRQYTSCFESP